ncbi:MAG: COX15/CtaA family protein [Holosporales bacterium]
MRSNPPTEEAQLARWLWIVLGMVLIMVALGGVTRLTGSGLSIVEWNVLVGTLPPLTAADWADLYAKYQASPEFNKINFGMSLEEFKGIFWLEYLHRLWGRAMGVVMLVPLWLSWRSPNLRRHVPKMIGVLALGGLQGAAGWFMVKSGLVDTPHVSPYRLMLHLLLALVIVATLSHMALSLGRNNTKQAGMPRTPLMAATLVLATITIAYGAMVAGFKAGLMYNTFPLMGNDWIPAEVLHYEPLWRNMFENPATLQLIHRWLAMTTVALSLIWAVTTLKSAPWWGYAVMGMALLQMTLGILTLIYGVPTALAASHQMGAFILWLLLWAVYVRAKPQERIPTALGLQPAAQH